MGLTVEDLKPKNFKIIIKGVELDCKPPKLSHILMFSKVGETFNNLKDVTKESVVQAQNDFDWVVGELLPELNDIDLDMQSVIDVITQIMEQVSPEETKELDARGVKFDTDPKVGTIG